MCKGRREGDHGRQEQRLENTCCDVTIIHEDVIERVRSGMPAEEELFDQPNSSRVFGDTTRFASSTPSFNRRCASAIWPTSWDLPNQPFPAQVLKQAKLVQFRHEGRVVYYSLADDHVKSIFAIRYQHIQERN